MKAKLRNGRITISMPVKDPKLSSTGKTMVVASSRGPRQTRALIDGKTLFVIAYAFFYPEPRVEDKKLKKKKQP
jgi:hypothetical protein